VPTLSLAQNTLLTRDDAIGPGGWLRTKGITGMAVELIDRYRVKAAGPHALAKSLSGGNLQKFIMGREIDAAPKVLLVSQPTWGVDVGAAAQIRGAGRIVRSERPPDGDGAGAAVAVHPGRRGHRGADRGLDERTLGGQPCSSLSRAPHPRRC
jgi:hypothetical protein